MTSGEEYEEYLQEWSPNSCPNAIRNSIQAWHNAVGDEPDLGDGRYPVRIRVYRSTIEADVKAQCQSASMGVGVGISRKFGPHLLYT